MHFPDCFPRMFTGFPCCIQCCIYAYVHREKERERERERDALVCAQISHTQIDIDIDIHIDIYIYMTPLAASASDEKLPAARGKKSLQDITSSKGQEARRHETFGS